MGECGRMSFPSCRAYAIPSSYIHPTFLNLMSLIVERAGRVHVRIGGNTQERARMVPSLGDGKAIEKEQVDSNNPVCAHILAGCL